MKRKYKNVKGHSGMYMLIREMYAIVDSGLREHPRSKPLKEIRERLEVLDKLQAEWRVKSVGRIDRSIQHLLS